MRQALKTNWQIDLPEAELDASLPAATPAPVQPAGATVLPFDAQPRRPLEARSEVVEVLSALSRAAEEIRNAGDRAAMAETTNRDFAGRLVASEERAREAEEKAAFFEEQFRTAEANIRLTERKFQQISDWQAQQVAQTEAELDRLRSAVEAAQARVIDLETAAAEQDAAMRAIIEDAGNRLFASETRANDAVRDYEALRDFVKANFIR